MNELVLWIVILLLSLWIIYKLVFPDPLRNQIPWDLEDVAKAIVEAVDRGDEDDGLGSEENWDFRGRSIRAGSFRARVVIAAKVEFGPTTRTQANLRMVRKFMRDMMRDRGMRPTHISQHLDICAAVFFIPSAGEVAAVQIGATSMALDREEAKHTNWIPYLGPVRAMLGFSSD